ncbi:hypothetical protein Efla_001898 [Eimeria flavescens]
MGEFGPSYGKRLSELMVVAPTVDSKVSREHSDQPPAPKHTPCKLRTRAQQLHAGIKQRRQRPQGGGADNNVQQAGQLSRSDSASKQLKEGSTTEREELLLALQCFGDKACEALCCQLEGAKQLRRLNLSSNNITSLGLFRLLPAIAALNQLQQLWLDWNPIVSGGHGKALVAARRLCETAASLACLQLLSLSHCQLGPDTASAVSDLILSKSTSLQELILRNNDLGEEGSAQLATSLEANRTITLLDLSGNGARPSTLRQVANRCADNKKISALLLQHSSHQRRIQQTGDELRRHQQQADDYVARVEAELKNSQQQSESFLRKLESELTSSTQKHREARRENFMLRQRIFELQSCTLQSNLIQDERRQLLKENTSLKRSLEEKYRELCEVRAEAQQQKLQAHLHQRQHRQQQQHLEMLQRQVDESHLVKDKLLSDLQQRELQLQEAELLLQQQRQDYARANALAAQQHEAAEQRQQLLQQEVEKLQQQHQQLQAELLQAAERHTKQRDESVMQQHSAQRQLEQSQHRVAELQQELQHEAARRQQAEKERLEERQAHAESLSKADQRIEVLQQRLHSQQEAGELQQRQLLQQQHRLAEAEKASAAAHLKVEELKSSQRHLKEKSLAAEAEWQRQQDLFNSRQELIQRLQQQLLEKHEDAIKEKERLQREAAAASARAEEKNQQLLQQLQQQQRQQHEQHLELQAAQSEAQQWQADVVALQENHSQLAHELQRTKDQCTKAQDQARQNAAELRRRQRQWQQERKDLWAYLQGGMDKLQAAMSSTTFDRSTSECDSG